MTKFFKHVFLVLLVVGYFSTAALASSVAIGYISYDDNTPTFGLAEFDVYNQTGPNSSVFPDPTFPVTNSVNLSNLSLTVTYLGGSMATFGSGFFSLQGDGLSFAGPVVIDTDAIVSAVLTGNVSPGPWILNDGSTFIPNAGLSFSVAFSGSGVNGTFQDGDLGVMYVNSGAPEPGTWLLLGSGVITMLRFRPSRR